MMIVQIGLRNELQPLSLLSYIASVMDYLRLGNPGRRRTIRITQKALSALQAQLRLNSFTHLELLHDVWGLFRAAELQDDEFTAAAHSRVIKHLVDKSGGLQALPSHLVQMILDVDLGQAFSEIRRPTLMLA